MRVSFELSEGNSPGQVEKARKGKIKGQTEGQGNTPPALPCLPKPKYERNGQKRNDTHHNHPHKPAQGLESSLRHWRAVHLESRISILKEVMLRTPLL